jgi:glycerol-3-phosphate acyltransferase PlsY
VQLDITDIAVLAVACVVGFLLGAFPTAHLVGRRLGFDPASSGSGNPGATNALRLGGRRAGLLVLLGDLTKGAGAAACGLVLGGPSVAVLVGAAAVAGHVAPPDATRRGGKGVATTAGVALIVTPLATCAALLAFVAVTSATRLVSAGSVAAALVLPVAAAATGAGDLVVVGIGILALVVVARHRGNLSRIRSGTEARLGEPTGAAGRAEAHGDEEAACRERYARR